MATPEDVLRKQLAEQQALNAELHRTGACAGYAALLAQMDQVGNALIGPKAGHHDGAEVVAAAVRLRAELAAKGGK